MVAEVEKKIRVLVFLANKVAKREYSTTMHPNVFIHYLKEENYILVLNSKSDSLSVLYKQAIISRFFCLMYKLLFTSKQIVIN